MSKCSASKIGSGRLTNMWDAAAITFYLRCNFEYCLWGMSGMPRYTLSILNFVGNSGTGGFWDVPTIWPMTFALILSCFLVYQQRWRHFSSLNAWWPEIYWFHSVHSIIACHLARVFGIFQTWCLASAFTVRSQVIASQAFGGWFKDLGVQAVRRYVWGRQNFLLTRALLHPTWRLG